MLNDQFEGPNIWDEYLERIENADPQVVALGITDYWSLDLYEEVLTKKAEGRLPNVELIFPNVEVRFEVGTIAGKPINGHLLISPEDPDHLAQARGFLAKLSFEVKKETYHCTRENLIALGKAHDPNATSDQSALKVGTTQFKTTIQALNKAIAGSEWGAKERHHRRRRRQRRRYLGSEKRGLNGRDPARDRAVGRGHLLGQRWR